MLTKDVENVGRAGDVKEVADGYGRNFLLQSKACGAGGQGCGSRSEAS